MRPNDFSCLGPDQFTWEGAKKQSKLRFTSHWGVQGVGSGASMSSNASDNDANNGSNSNPSARHYGGGSKEGEYRHNWWISSHQGNPVEFGLQSDGDGRTSHAFDERQSQSVSDLLLKLNEGLTFRRDVDQCDLPPTLLEITTGLGGKTGGVKTVTPKYTHSNTSISAPDTTAREVGANAINPSDRSSRNVYSSYQRGGDASCPSSSAAGIAYSHTASEGASFVPPVESSIHYSVTEGRENESGVLSAGTRNTVCAPWSRSGCAIVADSLRAPEQQQGGTAPSATLVASAGVYTESCVKYSHKVPVQPVTSFEKATGSIIEAAGLPASIVSLVDYITEGQPDFLMKQKREVEEAKRESQQPHQTYTLKSHGTARPQYTQWHSQEQEKTSSTHIQPLRPQWSLASPLSGDVGELASAPQVNGLSLWSVAQKQKTYSKLLSDLLYFHADFFPPPPPPRVPPAERRARAERWYHYASKWNITHLLPPPPRTPLPEMATEAREGLPHLTCVPYYGEGWLRRSERWFAVVQQQFNYPRESIVIPLSPQTVVQHAICC
ncbi:hypothetical protein TRVL_01257 [Trypanosoma vivax]|uniref:Uncharacterized protein n=1 Tax=Trypanosoma vivax (strain Y486) TaxID=1055687 RepID=G0TZQ6_TRYVY|nr:hypothetical protein TRVL_01257 [Trypanosoma vivax]CCC50084.1 conserved hypothetical protein [Trypanosoma vivax Y486]